MQTVPRDRRLRFARFELDLDARELLRDGRPVRIQPQPLRVLEILLRLFKRAIGRKAASEAKLVDVMHVLRLSRDGLVD